MSTVGSLEQAVCNRLEEDFPNPAFWDLENELRPLIVEAMNIATLITGEPQVRAAAPATLTANATLQAMSDGALALIRMEGTGGATIDRTTVWELDQMFPGWEAETGPDIKFWFPFGLGQFGVYPKLTAQVQVILSAAQMPVNAFTPYTGAEPVPFQDEYDDGLVDYCVAMSRIKDGDSAFPQTAALYMRFVNKMVSLSNFAYRKDTLRFSQAVGAKSELSPVRSK